MDRADDNQKTTGMGRRELLKLGAGVVATAATVLKGDQVLAQGQSGSSRAATVPEGALPTLTRSGYRTPRGRLDGNDAMDDSTRKIVQYVHRFSEKDVTESLVRSVHRTMVDSIACLMTGFEEPPVRICAALAADAGVSPNAKLRSTVMGYGVTTTPELAAFANSVLIRMTDYNDHGPAGHASDLLPAAFSVGEAVHATGMQVLMGITVGYEVRGLSLGGSREAMAAAMAAGKVLGLDEDRLANALAFAIQPHVPLNKGEGHLAMWKGVRSAQYVKDGVWAALMASKGLTGPPAPFEGVGAFWSLYGRRDFQIPVMPNQTVIERQGAKRFPLEASSQAVQELLPQMRAFAKPGEIAEIRHYMPFAGWTEIGDNPKFDPLNRETADHSMAYLLCRGLIDGQLYLDSFTEAKVNDPVVRQLMSKMTITPVRGWSGNGPARVVIFKTNGDMRFWDTNNGRRTSEVDGQAAFNTPLTNEEITQKFNRAAAHHKVSEAQRDRARALWGDIRSLKDIGEAVQSLAKFGSPRPLDV